MRYAMLNMAVNTAGAIGLFYLFQALGWRPYLGIAVATSFAGWLNALMLWGTLARRGHFASDARLRRVLPLVLLSSVVMGGMLWLAAGQLAPWLGDHGPLWVRLSALAALVGAGLLVYGLLIQITGAVDLRKLGTYRRRAG